jgi:hypothetical protein
MYSQKEWLLNTLLEFYNNDATNLDTLKKIINREFLIGENSKKKLSIRIINWFVTNYAKQYFTVYNVEDKLNQSEKRFFVWTNYKSTEDSYSKNMFDPYCRQERIFIPYNDTQSIETTVGQLHFFKWAIVNKVIEYIINNFEEIEKDMSSRLNNTKRKNIDEHSGKTRKKREELSINACRSIKKEFIPSKISFLPSTNKVI